MEETLNEQVTIRGFSEQDLEAIVEIDRKILGKARWAYWKQQIESFPCPFSPVLSGLGI